MPMTMFFVVPTDVTELAYWPTGCL